MVKKRTVLLLLFLAILFANPAKAQHSVARIWNEALLESIRNDFARPTVHARNLFHVSAAMYDAWAYFDDTAEPYLLGKSLNGVECNWDQFFSEGVDRDQARIDAINYAAYSLLRTRFRDTGGNTGLIQNLHTNTLTSLGYTETSTGSNNPAITNGADLGLFIGQCYNEYGLNDGSNQENDYANQYYEVKNLPIVPGQYGNPLLVDFNRFQTIQLSNFVGQSGQEIGETPPFLSPEWGNVWPFAMDSDDYIVKKRDGHNWRIYNDPGPPPLFGGELHDEYIWGFGLVSRWSAHLDPNDGVMWDISPASIGNNPDLPEVFEDYRSFYSEDGGDLSSGHNINPSTGQPYEPNMVPRGDYTRVLAEFWADGPDSETPPGHWYTILNYVSDHPELEKKFKGEGRILDDLEWDIKSYFALGGAMHDAAISAWSIKGFYDYIRPISAIRSVGARGQSSDINGESYDVNAFPIFLDLMEIVDRRDPIVGPRLGLIGRMKVKAWRGPDFINRTPDGIAGVGWIMAEEWWPYQRPNFVTPPFAGYISGHSTFSRAAAEVLTLLTGDEYFPGGMGEFVAPRNEFLVFEEGPSVDVVLQWATYRDASDQTSLSRIWGGIHPPADDIPGRIIGEKVGIEAFNFAEEYFNGNSPSRFETIAPSVTVAPNPVNAGELLDMNLSRKLNDIKVELMKTDGSRINFQDFKVNGSSLSLNTAGLNSGLYILRLTGNTWSKSVRIIIQ